MTCPAIVPTADDCDLRVGVEVEPPERVGQMAHQLVAEGVEPIRQVQA
jgi:hypothetical protein